MTDKSRLVCSITAFIILAFFMTIEYFPATVILQIYIAVTSEVTIIEMIFFIPIMIFFSIKEKDFGNALFLIILMTAQIMFVSVYADQYQIEISPQTQEPANNRYYYEPLA